MLYEIVLYLTVFIFYVSADSGEIKRDFNPQIIGGFDADIRDAPYIVSLRHKSNNKHFCAGSLYTKSVVITGAHCFVLKQLKEIKIYAGSGTLTNEAASRTILQLITHPNYAMETFKNDYDVAIIFLRRPFVFNDEIKPIKLATSRPPDGTIVTISGWGYTQISGDNSQSLQQIRVKIISQTLCAYFYGELTNRMFCAGTDDGSPDICTNDSGDPLVYDDQLLGIASFGYGCGMTRYPGYAFIPAFLEWIDSTVEMMG